MFLPTCRGSPPPSPRTQTCGAWWRTPPPFSSHQTLGTSLHDLPYSQLSRIFCKNLNSWRVYDEIWKESPFELSLSVSEVLNSVYCILFIVFKESMKSTKYHRSITTSCCKDIRVRIIELEVSIRQKIDKISIILLYTS